MTMTKSGPRKPLLDAHGTQTRYDVISNFTSLIFLSIARIFYVKMAISEGRGGVCISIVGTGPCNPMKYSCYTEGDNILVNIVLTHGQYPSKYSPCILHRDSVTRTVSYSYQNSMWECFNML